MVPLGCSDESARCLTGKALASAITAASIYSMNRDKNMLPASIERAPTKMLLATLVHPEPVVDVDISESGGGVVIHRYRKREIYFGRVEGKGWFLVESCSPRTGHCIRYSYPLLDLKSLLFAVLNEKLYRWLHGELLDSLGTEGLQEYASEVMKIMDAFRWHPGWGEIVLPLSSNKLSSSIILNAGWLGGVGYRETKDRVPTAIICIADGIEVCPRHFTARVTDVINIIDMLERGNSIESNSMEEAQRRIEVISKQLLKSLDMLRTLEKLRVFFEDIIREAL